LSIQNVGQVGAGRAELLPSHPTFDEYRALVTGSTGEEVRLGLWYSFKICLVATLLATLAALSAGYFFMGSMIAPRLRGKLIGFVLSVFFVPPVIVAYSLTNLGSWIPGLNNATTKLMLVYTVGGFVMGFVVVLARYLTIPGAYFEQTLLEKQDRGAAYISTYIHKARSYNISVHSDYRILSVLGGILCSGFSRAGGA
jgi:ABC-type glycerol-3-phosphate transport system permease component